MPIKDPVKRAAYQKKYRKQWYARNRKRHIKNVMAWNEKRLAEMVAMVSAKKASGCCRCGFKIEIALDLHHRDPSQKEFNISEALRGGSRIMSLKRLAVELDKCDVLCANCHRIEHGTLKKLLPAA